MKKFRVICLLAIGIYILFSVVALSDGVYRLSRSDVQLFISSGVLISILAFVCILLLKQEDGKKGLLEGNFISLWFKRRRLEEEKRIKDLEGE